MKTKELLTMVEEFNAISEGIKNGEVTADEMREALDETMTHLVKAFDTIDLLIANEPIEGVTQEMREVMLAQMQKESDEYDKTEHKNDIALLLSMIDELDVTIGEALFMPYILEILNMSAEKLSNINKDIAKTTRKAIKRFNKRKEELGNEQLTSV